MFIKKKKSRNIKIIIIIIIIIIIMKIIILQNHIQKKKARHEPSGWSMFRRCSFNKKENKLNYYRRKDLKIM